MHFLFYSARKCTNTCAWRVYIYIYIYISVCIHVFMYVSMYASTDTYMCVGAFVHTHACISTYTYLNKHIHRVKCLQRAHLVVISPQVMWNCGHAAHCALLSAACRDTNACPAWARNKEIGLQGLFWSCRGLSQLYKASKGA